MATNSALYLTALDWAKRLDPKGNTADIVEMLAQTNELVDDMTLMECNNLASHTITQRTGLPTVYYRLINAGTLPSKSTTAQVTETTAILDAYSQVDTELVNKSRNPNKFRLTESRAFVEAMNQRTATTIWYGNQGTAPEEFTGMSTRYSSLSAGNAANVINAGGVGSDNCSVWLLTWGDNALSGLFPTGSKVGLKHEDKGEVLIQNANGVIGALLPMMVDRWSWKLGLALIDWRSCARICNIDVSNLVGETSAADLTKLMIKATWRVRGRMGKHVFYMNRTAAQMLDIQRAASVKAGGGLTFENLDGKTRMTFRGIPVHISDALLETEALVS